MLLILQSLNKRENLTLHGCHNHNYGIFELYPRIKDQKYIKSVIKHYRVDIDLKLSLT